MDQSLLGCLFHFLSVHHWGFFFDSLTIEWKPKRGDVYGYEKGDILYGQWINSGFLPSCSGLQVALAIESLKVADSLKSNSLSGDVIDSGNRWPLARMTAQMVPLCHTYRTMSGKMLLCTTVASCPWLSRTQSAWAFCTNWTAAQTCGSSTTAFSRMAACTSMLAFAPLRPQVWTQISLEIIVIKIIIIMTHLSFSGASTKSCAVCFT